MFSRKMLTSLVALIAMNAIHVGGQNFGDFIPSFMDIIGGFVPRSQRFGEPLQSQGYLVNRQSSVNGFEQDEFGQDSVPKAPGLFGQEGMENVPERFATRRSPRHFGQGELDGSGFRPGPGLNGPSFGRDGPGRPGRPEGPSGPGGPGRPGRPGLPGADDKPDIDLQPSEDGQGAGVDVEPAVPEQVENQTEDVESGDTAGDSQV